MKINSLTRRFYFKFLISGVVLAFSYSAIAQKLPPTDILPFSGSISIRYTPTHKAKCEIKTSIKNKGDFFSTKQTSNTVTDVFRSSSGELNVSNTMSGAFAEGMKSSDYFKLTYSVGDDGGFTADEPRFQTNLNFPAEEMEIFKEIFRKNEIPNGWIINKPLQYGAILQFTDMCKPIGSALKINLIASNRKGGLRVMGLGVIAGRESIILSGDESTICSAGSFNWGIESSMWMAFDRQSGLQNGGAKSVTTAITNGNSTVIEEEHICKVEGVSTEAIKSPALKATAEQRLQELKSLLDKKLISNELYEQKAAEILKVL